MKRVVGIACVLLLGTFCATVSAQEPHEAWMKYMAGTWEWDMPDGSKGTITFNMDKSAPVVVGHGKMMDDTWFSVMSWHGGEKVLIDRSFGNNGSQATVRYDNVQANEISGMEKGWGPEGEYTSKIKMTRVNEDTLTFQQTERVVGGESQEDVEITVTRAKYPKVPGAPDAEKKDDGN